MLESDKAIESMCIACSEDPERYIRSAKRDTENIKKSTADIEALLCSDTFGIGEVVKTKAIAKRLIQIATSLKFDMLSLESSYSDGEWNQGN
jgi:hypothetical protein